MRAKGSAAIAGLVLVPMLASCGEASESRTPPASEAPVADRPAELPVSTITDTAPREDSLRTALRSLLAGPTPEQRAAGTYSWFSDTTADALREVEVDDGRVVVDLDGDLHELIPNASTSAGSGILLADLDSVVFGFPWVEAVEYRMGGSCDAFWEWLQRECAVVTR